MSLRSKMAAMSAAGATLILAACGGGSEAPTSSSAGLGGSSPADMERAELAVVGPAGPGDTLLTVFRPTGAAPDQIRFKDASGNVIPVYKAANVEATTLEDIPAAIAFHPWRTGGAATGHLRLRFVPDVYRFKSATGWVWPAEASGYDSRRQVVIEQMPNTVGEVAVLGSQPATASYTAGSGSVEITVAGAGFHQLWAEGRRAIRAREPDVGQFFYIKGETYGWPDASGTVVSSFDPPAGSQDRIQVPQVAFQADPASFPFIAAMKNDAAGNPDAVIVRMDQWQASRHGVVDIDAQGQRVRVRPNLPTGWKFARSTGRRYFIENMPALLDAPGEWYWSPSSSRLKYIPFDTSQSKTLQFEVPRVEKLLAMKGNVGGGKWLEYVHFNRIKFRYAKDQGTVHTSNGYFDGQADVRISAAIELNDARHISFVQCEVAHTGGYGVWLNRRVKNARFAASDLYDLGAGGFKIALSGESDVDVANNSVDATGENLLLQNRIYGIGHGYPGAVGVGVGRSSGNKVIGNLVTDTTYSGISVGWNWDWYSSKAHDNLIRNNFLYNIGQNVLSDMGGIYMLGQAQGTEITGNVIKEVRPYAYKGHGIYADEGSTDLLVQGNIVVGAGGSGFFQHWGATNLVTGNAFAKVDRAFGIYARPPQGNDKKFPPGVDAMALLPATLNQNVFFPTVAGESMVSEANVGPKGMVVDATQKAWNEKAPALSGNRVSKQFMPQGATDALSPLCTGCVKSEDTIELREAFEVPYLANFELSPHGIAHDWRMLQPSTAWSAKLRWSGDITQEPVKEVDFRAYQWPLGVPSPLGIPDWYLTADPALLAEPSDPAIVYEKDADGLVYLALNDAARTKNTWEPFLQKSVEFADGFATSRFTMKFNATSRIWHQWRQEWGGSVSGPSIRFIAQGGSSTLVDVTVAGITVARVPINQRHDVEMFSPIAPAPATWWLSITCQDGRKAAVKGLPQATAGWTRFNSAVFVSEANVKTKTPIYAIQMSRQAADKVPPAHAVAYSTGMTPVVCQ